MAECERRSVKRRSAPSHDGCPRYEQEEDEEAGDDGEGRRAVAELPCFLFARSLARRDTTAQTDRIAPCDLDRRLLPFKLRPDRRRTVRRGREIFGRLALRPSPLLRESSRAHRARQGRSISAALRCLSRDPKSQPPLSRLKRARPPIFPTSCSPRLNLLYLTPPPLLQQSIMSVYKTRDWMR